MLLDETEEERYEETRLGLAARREALHALAEQEAMIHVVDGIVLVFWRRPRRVRLKAHLGE